MKSIRYYTMNNWNKSTAPAYNMKVYNVIPHELQGKVYDMMECEDFYDDINMLLSDFALEHDYNYQAGFNGRSGGYLVLYTGGRKDNKTFTYPAGISDEEVPEEVLKSFEQLAEDIIETVINNAENCKVIEETINIPQTRKVLVYA